MFKNPLPFNRKLKLVSYQCNQQERLELIKMGLLPGAELILLQKTPLGDPIEIKVDNTLLAVRKTILNQIHFEVIS